MMELDRLESILKLMQEYKIDSLKFDGLELIKSKHDAPKQETKPNLLSSLQDDEDLLFYSTSTPNLTPEEIEELAYSTAVKSPTKKNKKA